MPNEAWTRRPLPDRSGTVAVVTGANSGLGLATAHKLAEAGAHVVMASRDEDRGRAAVRDVLRQVPGASVEPGLLDLADLSSVRAFAERLPHDRLDLLVNNAGVMDIPLRRTADGFEAQFGTNHLGHFALTGLLLPALLAARGTARVVTVSSGMHSIGRIVPDDLNWERRPYRPMRAYGQSKLANLLFTAGLDRRAAEAGADLLSLAAHPGYAATNLQAVGARERGSRLRALVAGAGNRLFAQSALAGAWPGLHAATAPDVQGGDYFGPRRGHAGPPARASRSAAASDRATARLLWHASEELTTVRYDFTPVGT
ncbi:oxidoreductase [Actinorugispora endophytica]|uniref:NAD(P)-dependent dehydrogenase (Short-subunit alcohol dehydrogenase family) n=1 Tax=Actinorugispora endophytica TaxID=1605990 RepID=A0A4R6V7C3_9ACTN|nr:oxidoreductase [Actinorugispora endophytica]TDQ52193.1 NAD(P)-dependent dehydrogenase (short-subunit alcohol dehydrogenase family) [Actinorugispora endophytica]